MGNSIPFAQEGKPIARLLQEPLLVRAEETADACGTTGKLPASVLGVSVDEALLRLRWKQSATTFAGDMSGPLH